MSNNTAGFAFVGCASQDLINSVLRAVQANFVPPYVFSLPNSVTVGTTAVSIAGSVAMNAPEVGLAIRPDNLVSVNFSFGGQVTLSAGAQSMQAVVLLSTSLLVGLVSNVSTAANQQQITVGLDLSLASVTAVDAATLVGPPLSPVFSSALTSPAVLNAMTGALRDAPPGLVQITAANLNLPLNVVQTYQSGSNLPRTDLKWCNKCQGLFFAGNNTPGVCPAGGAHDDSTSANYGLSTSGGQTDWMGCSKCQGLFFAGNNTLGVCPAGGAHDKTGSANYSLFSTGFGQRDWRWCNQCQGLFFAGNSTLGVCPGSSPPGGAHSDSGSSNYTMSELETLFQLQFAVSRIVAQPVGDALAVAIDMSAPVASTGDPNALSGLNTQAVTHGNILDFGAGFASDPGGVSSHNSSAAFSVNGDWICAIVNNVVSPQLASKFVGTLATDFVAFEGSSDCLQISFGNFNAPLDSPWSPPIPTSMALSGLILQASMTKWSTVTIDNLGYLVPGSGPTITVTCTADIIVLLQTFDGQLPSLPEPVPGVEIQSVAFSTTPAGGYVYVDGAPIRLGVGPYNYGSQQLGIGTHSLSSNPVTFQSWSTSGNVSVDNPSANPAVLTVNGPGSVSLQQSSFDPYLTRDFWNIVVVGTEVSTPSWLDILGITFGPLYVAVTSIAGLFGADIWYPTIVGNVNASASGALQNVLNGALPAPIFLNHSMLVTQLPGTNAPNWLVTVSDVVLSADGVGGYVNANLLPPGLVEGSTGAFPYLLVTDQDVSNPGTYPTLTGTRVDGSFNWPGIAWNEPGAGDPGGSIGWDVHDVNPIGVVLMIPQGLFNPQDPTVLVQWTVERTDTNAVIISQTLSIAEASPPSNSLAVSIEHASLALQAADGFQVICSVFRPLASGGTEQIFSSGNVNIVISDHFDRHHPYVQWAPHNKFIYPGEPFWSAIPRGAAIPGLSWMRQVRQSRIHRTDVWSGGRRCLVADTSGLMGNLPGKFRGTAAGYKAQQMQQARGLDFPWDYIDTLPISLDDVSRDRNLARGVLCDYCFFGGPTKTRLRSDIPEG